jgi:hypothetical protein
MNLKCVDGPVNNMFTVGKKYPIHSTHNNLVFIRCNLGHERAVYIEEDKKGNFIVKNDWPKASPERSFFLLDNSDEVS